MNSGAKRFSLGLVVAGLLLLIAIAAFGIARKAAPEEDPTVTIEGVFPDRR